MRVMSFLTMSHKLAPAELAEQARKLDSYGAQVVYVVDSAVFLVPCGAAERVAALREAVSADLGFHAHNNLGVGIGNALAEARTERTTSMARCADSAPGRATRRPRCWQRRWNGPDTRPASTCSH